MDKASARALGNLSNNDDYSVLCSLLMEKYHANIVTPTPYCMVLRKDPDDTALNIIASGQVKGGSGKYAGAIITKIVKVA